VTDGLAPGPDGEPRCWWAVSAPEYVRYHDEEWGRPVRDDRGLFERLCLEAFQSGLSWLTILRKREAFRAAFAGFDPAAVAEFGEHDVARLMADAGIVRNRAKVEAAIGNARAAEAMRADGESLSELIWSFAPRRHEPPRTRADVPAVTPESTALANELKRRGFRFVGPTTAYALMQACGLVDDHLAGCAARELGRPRFRRLAPADGTATARELLAAVRPAARAPADRPFVFANFVATLDGRAAVAGRTTALGSEADLEMLLELRGLADAVLIGTGTLRAEGYGRLMRSEERRAHRSSAGLAPDPPAVVIARGLDVPWEAGLFAAPEQPVLVYTGSQGKAPAVAAPVEVVRLEDPAPAAVLADLRRRSVRSLLCEGGPRLLGALLASGLVDELFLTLAPLLTGEHAAPRLVEGRELPELERARLGWVLRAGDELFLRYAL